MKSQVDLVLVRNADEAVVFLGERENVKCLESLKKINDNVFEVPQGFDGDYELTTEESFQNIARPTVSATPLSPFEQMAVEDIKRYRAGLSVDLGKYGTCLTVPAPQQPPKPPKLMSFDEQVEHDWKTQPEIRKEFLGFENYKAYRHAVKDGRCRIHGGR